MTDEQVIANAVVEAMPQRDVWSTRAVVIILGGALLLALVLSGLLLMTDHSVPDQLWQLVATITGAVSALLVSTRAK